MYVCMYVYIYIYIHTYIYIYIYGERERERCVHVLMLRAPRDPSARDSYIY